MTLTKSGAVKIIHFLDMTYNTDSRTVAMEAVENERMSQRQAAKTRGVPQATLSDHLCGRSVVGVQAGNCPS